MKYFKLILYVFVSFHNTYAQEYFQQEVNYKINVELDDENHKLIGNINIEYKNNSEDPLDIIWMHLWPNAYKNNSTALVQQMVQENNFDLYYADSCDRGYIHNLNFHVNNEKVSWEFHNKHIDICKIILNKPIKPGTVISIQTPFVVKIPHAKFSRLGHIEQSYMITQWYPKPAVYDTKGWHFMPYLNQGEFFSEYGSFDVSINLPKNYTVGATGELKSEKEILRLDSIANITNNKEFFSNNMEFPKSSSQKKTLRYVEKNIHDFAFFADKRYHVLKGTVSLPYSEKKVTLYSMFTNNEAKLWKNSIEYIHDAIYYYSLWNGEYPYKYCTAVDGTISAGGGMEYPNVTVIGESKNEKALEEVIMHEVGHNWFYGILGSNERDYPWMDEGINSFYELRYMKKKYPEYNLILNSIPKSLIKIFDLKDYSNKQIIGELPYMINAWQAKDQPIDFHSENYTSMNYGGIVYMKTAIAIDYLRSYLGTEAFDDCMKSYYEMWKFKHPSPNDLRSIFEIKTKKNLTWFFENMIKTTNQLDYSIDRVTEIMDNDKIIKIELKNNGKVNGPLVICGVKDNIPGKEIWIDGFSDKIEITYQNNEYDHIRIDYHGVMPETNRNNNIYKLKGPLKKIEPIKFQLFGSLYHPEKTQLFYFPNFNWNRYNKLSAGISLYNKFIPRNGLSFKFSPMYSFNNKQLVGKGKLSYSKYSHHSNFSKIKIDILSEKYNYTNIFQYHRFIPSVEIVLNEFDLRSKIEHKLKASYIMLMKDGYDKDLDLNFSPPGNLPIKEQINFINLDYSFKNNRPINPYNIYLKFEKSDDFSKGHFIFNYTTRLNKNKKIYSRLYAGLTNINANYNIYSIQMSAWNGSMDYTFQESSFSREKIGELSRQMFLREGGLKHYTNQSSNRFLTTINTNTNISKQISIYAEAGTSLNYLAYGTGINIKLGAIDIYVPVYTENGIFNGMNFQEVIRVELNSLLPNLIDFNL